MNNIKSLILISTVSAVVCVGSAVLASNLPGSEDSTSEMSNLRTLMLITLLVTFPAFLVCVLTLLGGIIAFFTTRKK